jgi:thymidylate kinase
VRIDSSPAAPSMVDTNLILVDGLPGSGKSATAQLVWLHLLKNQQDASWYFEHQSSHPIYRLDNLAKVYRSSLSKSRRTHQQALVKWQRLADSLHDTRRIVILESTFFQTTIGWLQLMNVARHEILDYVARVEERIEKARPVLVYLYQKDPATALRNIRAQRGDWFEDLLVTQMSKAPFGRAHGLRDFEGVIEFFLRIRSMTDEIYARSRFTKIALDTTDRHWSKYLDDMTDVLSVPRIDHCRSASTNHRELTGTYSSRRFWRTESLTISADAAGLFFDDAARTRLIHKAGNVFCIQGMCVELSFRVGNGAIEIECTGDLPSLPRVWRRSTRPEYR